MLAPSLLRRLGFVAVVASTSLTACSSPQTAPPSQSPPQSKLGFEEARAMFASQGPQPGQQLPAMSVRSIDGTTYDLRTLAGPKSLVIVTASLTCNVARRQQEEFEKLAARWGDRATFVTLYTIDAHPAVDVCPYTGKVWVPKDNERDNVLVRQPTTDQERTALAERYRAAYVTNSMLVIDSIDNAAWNAIGNAPNLGVLVDPQGVILLRQGWFDSEAMDEAIAAMLGSSGRVTLRDPS